MHARRGAALGGGAVSGATVRGRPRVVTSRHVQPRRRDLGRRQQRLGRRRRRRVRRHRRRRTTPRRSPRPSAAAGCWPSCARTRTTTTSPPRRPCAEATGAPAYCCTRPTGCSGTRVHSAAARTATLADGQVFGSAASRSQVLHTPGHSPGLVLPLRPGARRRCSPATRCSGRAGRDRALVQRLPDDRRVDPRPAADPARPRRSSTPGTATRPPSAPRPRTCEEWIDRGH